MNAQPPTTLASGTGEPADLLAAADRLLPQIKRLPQLSHLVNDFLTLSRKQYLTAREFEEVISRDRDLHAWLIRQANSGFFNPARPILTIADASVIIGLDALQRMVHAVCSRDLLRYRMRCYHLPGNGFWLHSLAVAACCRSLAGAGDRCPLNAEEAFVAGLLHDVGKRVLDGLLPRRGGQRPIDRAQELAACGVDHAVLSARIIDQWGLPAGIGEAVRRHHASAEAALQPGGALVQLADAICTDWGVGIWTYPKLDLEIDPARYRRQLSALGFVNTVLVDQLDTLRPLLANLDEMLRALDHNPVVRKGSASSDTAAEAAGAAAPGNTTGSDDRSRHDRQQSHRQRSGRQRRQARGRLRRRRRSR